MLRYHRWMSHRWFSPGGHLRHLENRIDIASPNRNPDPIGCPWYTALGKYLVDADEWWSMFRISIVGIWLDRLFERTERFECIIDHLHVVLSMNWLSISKKNLFVSFITVLLELASCNAFSLRWVQITWIINRPSWAISCSRNLYRSKSS